MEEDFPDFPDFINTAYRVSLGMGLHRKVSVSNFADHELEVRRRLWWYILHLDIMSSCSSGLSPLFVDNRMMSVGMISQSDDLRGGEIAEHHIGMFDVRYLVATKRYTVSSEIRRILRLHFEDGLQTIEQVNEAAAKLQIVAQEVGETVHLLIAHARVLNPRGPTTSTTESHDNTPRRGVTPFDNAWSFDNGDSEVHNFCAWAAILIHLMVHKAFCVLYHALFRDPEMVSDMHIRTSAVVHAQAFLQLFIRLCNDPTSVPFHWMYPGIYQPLQATSLLIADLLKFPNSPEAPLSRGLIDAVFDQFEVDEGLISIAAPLPRQLSGTGRDAWNMLAAGRKKALSMASEDPHVLLPSRCSYSDICICGERFAESQRVEQFRRSEVPEDPMSSTAPQDFPPLSLDDTEFDWYAWDATVGGVTGFIS
ncbi:hypothetical protein IQ07DRAFT_646375 [Pyrenochaeta sp. DS3sAY3a]|nr:hypothetical protein IQ07DRAFT_646375 [Pyrenochaeta sp. DS3sAY3a]